MQYDAENMTVRQIFRPCSFAGGHPACTLLKQQLCVQTIVLASVRIIPVIKSVNILSQMTIDPVTMQVFCILTLTQSKQWQATMLKMGVR